MHHFKPLPKHAPVFLLAVGILLVSSALAQKTLTVALSDSIRPVTHCASGSLYGMTETLPADIAKHVAPLKPNVFVNPAISGNGHQQPIGDALKVSERLVGTTGKVQIRLADILPGWPYKWPGQQSWLASVKSIIQNKLASGRSNFDGYEIWNEPDGTWQSGNGDFNTVLWKPTYDLIRSLDPSAKIIGPSYSFFARNKMSTFLNFCKSNNVLPDVVSWHQWGSESFIGTLEDYRSLEKSLGISARRISINEYSSGTHEYEGSPGVSVPFIAKFERNNVESAMISWWFTNLPGRLGSLLTDKNEKGGGWWLYKWYGDMTGYMAKVTPPNDKSDSVDGFAAVDKNAQYASIVVGGNSVGTVNVNIGGIPSSFGADLNVKVESVGWVNKDTPVAGTKTISEKQIKANANAISVTISIASQFEAFRIYITPVNPSSSSSSSQTSSSSVIQSAYSSATIPGILQVENFDKGGMDVSYYDSDVENSGTAKSYRTESVDLETNGQDIILGYTIAGEWLEYEVNILQDGPIDFTCKVASGLESGKLLLWMDQAIISDTVSIPNTGGWSTYGTVSGTTKSLSKGKHILRLSVEGSYFNLDWIDFAKTEPVLIDRRKRLYVLPTQLNAHDFDLMGRIKL